MLPAPGKSRSNRPEERSDDKVAVTVRRDERRRVGVHAKQSVIRTCGVLWGPTVRRGVVNWSIVNPAGSSREATSVDSHGFQPVETISQPIKAAFAPAPATRR